jgi:hypothetical protein
MGNTVSVVAQRDFSALSRADLVWLLARLDRDVPGAVDLALAALAGTVRRAWEDGGSGQAWSAPG